MSAFWFERFADVSVATPSPLARRSPTRGAASRGKAGSALQAAEMLPIECIVRGAITVGVEGVQGERHDAAHLCPPIFSRPPSSRAGLHAVHQGRRGPRRTSRSRPRSTSSASSLPRRRGRRSSLQHRRGVGREARYHHRRHEVRAGFVDGELVLADDPHPDSSRRLADVSTRRPPPSFDKQPVRDYLDGLDWDSSRRPAAARRRRGRHAARYIDARAHHHLVVRRLARVTQIIDVGCPKGRLGVGE